jgi:hypothetical protein
MHGWFCLVDSLKDLVEFPLNYLERCDWRFDFSNPARLLWELKGSISLGLRNNVEMVNQPRFCYVEKLRNVRTCLQGKELIAQLFARC